MHPRISVIPLGSVILKGGNWGKLSNNGCLARIRLRSPETVGDTPPIWDTPILFGKLQQGYCKLQFTRVAFEHLFDMPTCVVFVRKIDLTLRKVEFLAVEPQKPILKACRAAGVVGY